MMGSIDMLASSGRRSGMACQRLGAPADGRGGGRTSSRIRVQVAMKATKITAPAAKKVQRMPIHWGSTPPTRGPTRLPAITADDKVPRAQPAWALGVWVATITVEPEA